ncbi:unnamed protein product [Thelazia callipaeda]|uniref:UBA_6 domain-containing protein n=1 Tax=Thelazia callipaeda TaxID=103827 RepID=A0A0N5CP06_THECL|nr:unnamed protein product [Thelazia callipaeda]
MERHDSSYSSCSEESSHSSMSRESSCSTTKSVIQSSTIDSESTHKNQSEMDEFLRRNTDFATRLGFSVEQLKIVLEKLGTNAGQDEILTELIKFGRGFSRSRITASNQTNVILPVQFRSIVIDGSNIAMTFVHLRIFTQ